MNKKEAKDCWLLFYNLVKERSQRITLFLVDSVKLTPLFVSFFFEIMRYGKKMQGENNREIYYVEA
ncbi:hypothetical protein H6234_001861 [Enterococcus hirae]|uniref:hypothetical protein n=1 Tax=Enterococcus TaxID=1350 RepID=UPI0019F9C3E4|nr:hypothetical protein [Enterococcus hirae]EMF0516855.1 hypothetical protein [Enterococcus hirae]EMF0519415.1 hypothetical protein [Enterococcus hirae]MEB7518119.1 hypothetical protein [Enterococcus hirae]